MKYFFSLLISLLFLTLPVKAGDIDLPSNGDLWDNWNSSQDFYGQDKNITDEDFEKTVKKLEEKKNKKLKKKNTPKGEEFRQSNETEIINEQIGDKDSLPVICLPVELLVGEGILPVGHYQVKGEKNGNKITLNFYQAQFLMAQIPAAETTEDFGEDEILFIKWEPDGDYKIKIMYGSMEFNAYAYVEIK
ncbi:hypothetical protein IJ541_10575 [bacterium]|nr:hypothetical protein [bacterium]